MACNRPILAIALGYRQVTTPHNKHRTVHAIVREPFLRTCPRVVENWRYSKQ